MISSYLKGLEEILKLSIVVIHDLKWTEEQSLTVSLSQQSGVCMHVYTGVHTCECGHTVWHSAHSEDEDNCWLSLITVYLIWELVSLLAAAYAGLAALCESRVRETLLTLTYNFSWGIGVRYVGRPNSGLSHFYGEKMALTALLLVPPHSELVLVGENL